MAEGISSVRYPANEPKLNYAPGSKERAALKAALEDLKKEPKDFPMYIGGEPVYTDNQVRVSPPHDHNLTLGQYHKGDSSHAQKAIDAALKAKPHWENIPWEQRISIFQKAAELASGPYRAKLCAATMLGQSKDAWQSEIEAVCELIDFWRFNAYFLRQLYEDQPYSPQGLWNRQELRPLEGFVFAITPFNFTAITGNLPSAPAMAGNTVVWKPNPNTALACEVIMEILMEAGLPEGVINLIHTEGPDAGDIIFRHPDFAGLHFTGSTAVFQELWKQIGHNIHRYRIYPRIVGETGGKDFIIAHQSADPKALSTAIIRGAFEFQGQKCSAASRVYIPDNMWEEVKQYLLDDYEYISVGPPEDFRNYVNAVIDEKAFDKIAGYIEHGKNDPETELLAGGDYDKSKGYFIDPTIFVTTNPHVKLMEEEIFGPVVCIYVYPANEFEKTLDIVDGTSSYGLTGSVFSRDRYAVQKATEKLRHAAGNFYINDKPTGSIVGQQPFGGHRKSGTNDKAGSMYNMLRWVSPRNIKENYTPPHNFRYPFMEEE